MQNNTARLYRSDLPAWAVTVYLYLRSRSDRHDQRWPFLKRIASDLHISVATVKRAISDLERHGFLLRESRWREQGGRSSNKYTLFS